MSRLFAGAFRYKAWANRALPDGGERQWASPPDGDARFFVRILNHAHAVHPSAGATAEDRSRGIRFAFIGGGLGCMRAEEILLRLLTHGNIHRGMAERVPAVHGLDRPAGTFAHFRHLADAARRNGKPASRSPA